MEKEITFYIKCVKKEKVPVETEEELNDKIEELRDKLDEEIFIDNYEIDMIEVDGKYYGC